MNLSEIVASVIPVDADAFREATDRTSQLIMPPRAMGMLNDISERLCAIQRTMKPKVDRRGVFVMVGDHGVVEENVSAFPAEVTPQMVMAFLGGIATINTLARQAECRVVVADIGMKTPLAEAAVKGEGRFIDRNVGRGTKNFTKERAMSREDAEAAIIAGYEVAAEEIDSGGLNLIATGDMGIGNTTPSAAIAAAVTGLDVSVVTGRGAGADDVRLSNKVAAIEAALKRHTPDAKNAIDLVSAVGGYEIAAIAGVILAGASRRIPVIVDGVISAAGAAIAAIACPTAVQYMFVGHASVEPGQKAIVEHLGLSHILQLDMRLGEGTGAVLAMHIVEAASRIITEIATFAEAGVSEKEDSEVDAAHD